MVQLQELVLTLPMRQFSILTKLSVMFFGSAHCKRRKKGLFAPYKRPLDVNVCYVSENKRTRLLLMQRK